MPNLISVARRAGICALLGLLLSGCAHDGGRKSDPGDPLERFNRKSFAFNLEMDKRFIRPTAVVYRKVTNRRTREIVTDFFYNLSMPVTIGNDLLQGKGRDALRSTGRFLMNTVVGLGGLFDPASGVGLHRQHEDFGQTLAIWGASEGAYLVIPMFGPSSVRDLPSFLVDSQMNPLAIYTHQTKDFLPQFLSLVSLRSRGLDAEAFLNEAFDPYLFARDAYRQRRNYDIHDGNPPEESLDGIEDFDPDALLEEMENAAPEEKKK